MNEVLKERLKVAGRIFLVLVVIAAVTLGAIAFTRSSSAPTPVLMPAPAPAPESVSRPEPAPQPESVSRQEFKDCVQRVDVLEEGFAGFEEQLDNLETKVDEGQSAILESLDDLEDLVTAEKEVVEPSPQPSQTPIVIVLSQDQSSSYYQSPCQDYRWPRHSRGEFHASVYEEGVNRWYMGWFESDDINYNWGNGCPEQFNLKSFSVTFKGEIEITETGTWMFVINSDDSNAQFTINGRRIYNHGAIYLNQGRYQVEVKYAHKCGNNAHLNLYWQKS